MKRLKVLQQFSQTLEPQSNWKAVMRPSGSWEETNVCKHQLTEAKLKRMGKIYLQPRERLMKSFIKPHLGVIRFCKLLNNQLDAVFPQTDLPFYLHFCLKYWHDAICCVCMLDFRLKLFHSPESHISKRGQLSGCWRRDQIEKSVCTHKKYSD